MVALPLVFRPPPIMDQSNSSQMQQNRGGPTYSDSDLNSAQSPEFNTQLAKYGALGSPAQEQVASTKEERKEYLRRVKGCAKWWNADADKKWEDKTAKAKKRFILDTRRLQQQCDDEVAAAEAERQQAKKTNKSIIERQMIFFKADRIVPPNYGGLPAVGAPKKRKRSPKKATAAAAMPAVAEALTTAQAPPTTKRACTEMKRSSQLVVATHAAATAPATPITELATNFATQLHTHTPFEQTADTPDPNRSN